MRVWSKRKKTKGRTTRSRSRVVVAAAAALLAASAAFVTASCSSPPEQPILYQFFASSRLRDNTALRNFSTVTLEPREAGTVNGFEITAVHADADAKDVTVSARMTLPNGEPAQKTIVVTMRRVDGRWMIVGAQVL